MKAVRIIMAVFISLIVTAAAAQVSFLDENTEKKDNPPKVLVDIETAEFSGYAGIYSRYSKISDTYGYLAGVRSGLIINDNFAIGIGAMALVLPTDMKEFAGDDYAGDFDKVRLGYCGMLFEYYFNPKDLIVFSAGTLIGGGVLKLTGEAADSSNDAFFAVEPEINIFVNITRFCRIGIGTSYRYITGINSEYLENGDFSGFTVSAMAQFGWF